MLDTETKRRIDTARDILVGKVPDPKSQVEQITIALIYKFMDDMDAESEELGGKRSFFAGKFARYGWPKLMRSGLGGHEVLALYAEAIAKMPENPGIPALFRDIFKNAYLPYRDPETLKSFLKIIDEFEYDHSERLGDAFEYLLSVLGSQGDAGQFRTPRHIIDFMVEIIDPKKDETILDPACGTAGFLISSYKHILRGNSSKTTKPSPQPSPRGRGGSDGERRGSHYRGGYDFSGLKQRVRELRKTQTEAEALLWELLRDRQLENAKFRRQHQFGDYICDFYCHDAKLVVECDGEVHNTAKQRRHDAKRDAYLKSQGLIVVRFQNSSVITDPETVLKEIGAHLPSPPAHLPSPPAHLPSPPGRGAGGEGVCRPGDLLTPDDKGHLAKNFRGYDISPDMVRLSLVNLYLHGFNDPHIDEYDTLTSEDKWNEFADVILANPPFMSPKGGIKPHRRFSVQSKRSEVLFVDYMAEHLTPGGRAGIIVPEGIIFQSQNAYKQLRKMLVDEYLVAVVSLPAGVFQPYSGVKTSILILDKSLARHSDTLAFFKVENDGFGLGAQRRKIDKNDLPQVKAELEEYLNALRNREPVDALEPTLGLIVEKEKIAENGEYNLSGERYGESTRLIHTDWPTVSLGETCTFMTGGTPKSTVSEYYEDGDVPWLVSGDIHKFKIRKAEKHITPKGVENSNARTLPKDSVLIALNGQGKTRGTVALLRMEDATCNQSLVAISPAIIPKVLPEFLFWTLRSMYADIRALTGDTQRSGLNIPILKSIQIPLPPLSVQKEIVAEIEGYQKVIDGARAVLDNYRPHIPIHPDWPISEISDISTIVRGSSPRPKGDPQFYDGPVPRLMVADITRDGMYTTPRIDSLTEEGAKKSRPMNKGDVIITVSGNPGLPTILSIDACIHDGFVGLRDLNTDNVLPEYLYFNLLSQHKVHGSQSVGAVFKNLTTHQIREFKIALPPIGEQKAIVAEIEVEQSLVAANRELIERMEKKIQATIARVWGEEDKEHG